MVQRGYLKEREKLDASFTKQSYNIFEGIISGRNYYKNEETPDEMFRSLYETKNVCGLVVAQKVIETMKTANKEDSFIIIGEIWHMAYGFGIPEFL